MSAPGRQLDGGLLPRVYRVMLRAYPASFRARYGADMLEDLGHLRRDARRRGGRAQVRLLRRITVDWLRSVVRERGGGGTTLPGLPSSGRPPFLAATRLGARRLLATPGFTALAVAVLALGLGPAIGAWGIADAVLYRPVAGVQDQDELGFVWYGSPSEYGVTVARISYLNLQEMLPRLETLQGLAGMQGGGAYLLNEEGIADALSVRHVTASYFELLGLRPAAGRFFRTAEDVAAPAGLAPIVISHRLAGSRFGSPERAVGVTLRLSERDVEVVGVMPAGFHGLVRNQQHDIWMPGTQQGWIRGLDFGDPWSERDGLGFYELVGRLAPGATWEQVGAELAGLNVWLAESYPATNAHMTERQFLIYPGVGLGALGRENLQRRIWLIGAITLAVLVIACANTAGLLLNRGLARRDQVAIHKALGAPAGRLVREALAESAWLGVAAAGVGFLVAKGLLHLGGGVSLGWGMRQQLLSGADIPWSMALSVAAVGVLVAVVAGTLATLDAARVDPARWLANGSRGSSRRARTWQLGLGVVQLAITVPLVVGALLFGESLRALTEVDLGADPDGVRILRFTGNEAEDDPLLQTAGLMAALGGVPEIEGHAVATGFPVFGASMITRVRPAGSPPETEAVEGREVRVTADYFAVLRIPVLRGRSFRADEVMAPGMEPSDRLVLSELAAVRLFGSIDQAVGAEVEFAYAARAGHRHRVLGVVGDVTLRDPADPIEPVVYLPLDEFGVRTGAMVAVRTRAADGPLLASVSRTLRDAGTVARHPVREVRHLSAILDDYLSEPRLLVSLFVGLSLVGLVLGVVGLASSAVRAVMARTREIGIRKALGAHRRRIVREAVGQLAIGIGAGGALGLGLTLLAVSWIESRLYRVTPDQPGVWAATVLLLMVAALIAGIWPARRAARIEPAIALRDQA